ncbi:MAG: Txe/YoeB family addiction module toxin [Pseudanabaena sp. CAN_BIN31]|nr:Txe/YoeB family addiction module toxin [Pseudanabaena sp. CAN_BIN31]
MRNIVFEPQAFQDFNNWAREDKKIYGKIVNLISDILRSPFDGIGQPEPLKYELKGYWSKRITDEHRLVYKVNEYAVTIVGCRFHYEK